MTCHASRPRRSRRPRCSIPARRAIASPATIRMPARRRASCNLTRCNACLACHSEQADQMKKAVHHQPAFKQGCATCHEPHGSDNDHLLRAQGQHAVPGVSWARLPPAKAGSRARAHHFQRPGKAAGGLLPEEQGRHPADQVRPRSPDRWATRCRTSWIRPTSPRSRPRSIA